MCIHDEGSKEGDRIVDLLPGWANLESFYCYLTLEASLFLLLEVQPVCKTSLVRIQGHLLFAHHKLYRVGF